MKIKIAEAGLQNEKNEQLCQTIQYRKLQADEICKNARSDGFKIHYNRILHGMP